MTKKTPTINIWIATKPLKVTLPSKEILIIPAREFLFLVSSDETSMTFKTEKGQKIRVSKAASLEGLIQKIDIP